MTETPREIERGTRRESGPPPPTSPPSDAADLASGSDPAAGADTGPIAGPPMRSFLVHYNEVGLKRGNRGHFEQSLIRNIQQGLRGLKVDLVKRLFGRLRIDQRPEGDGDELERRLARIHGVAHFSRAERFVDWDLAPVEARLAEWADEGGFESFAIRCRRLEKRFPLRSQEIKVRLGDLVRVRSGARVDLENPERTFHVLVLNREIFLHGHWTEGAGGLPVGTAGRVMMMLSGGIDSPVAAERLMRRGCHPQFVHFHSSPFTDRSSIAKATELAELLCEHRAVTKLHLVPLGILQQRIVAEAPAAWRVMLYRRYMLRLAAMIARREKCVALGTGENLAQVASQTLDNLGVLDRTVDVPLLRPLLTYDKNEIIDEAKRIGTFDLSIEKHSDCCGYLLPRNPVIAARLSQIEAIEESLDLAEEIAEVLARTTTVRVGADED